MLNGGIKMHKFNHKFVIIAKNYYICIFINQCKQEAYNTVMEYQVVSEKKPRVRSKISDEELARRIEEDCMRNPSGYSSGPIEYGEPIPNSNYFFRKSSGCGIEQVMKWL